MTEERVSNVMMTQRYDSRDLIRKAKFEFMSRENIVDEQEQRQTKKNFKVLDKDRLLKRRV